jgi:hypothetical protein
MVSKICFPKSLCGHVSRTVVKVAFFRMRADRKSYCSALIGSAAVSPIGTPPILESEYMELDVLLRGQSNAYLFAGSEFAGAGARTLVDEVQRLLGFDGVNDQVRLTAEWNTPGQETIYAASAFLGDWVQRDATGNWQPLYHEQSLLNYLAGHPHVQSTETATIWIHSEYDSRNAGLTAAEWESAVRADAAWVRQALGQDAAHSPYVFLSAFPFAAASDAATQAIRQGMEDLAADPAFGALVGARALDTDMSYKFPDEISSLNYGLSHMSQQDTVQTAERLARSLAEEWAEYARPNSPIAVAGGAIDDDGPRVIDASVQDANTLLVRVAHDHTVGFAPLSPAAAAGTGWSVRSAGSVATADHANIVAGDTLLLHFATPMPNDGTLFYGYGYGRLAGSEQPGEGNAVYDQAGLPIWTPAQGVTIDTSANVGWENANGTWVQQAAAPYAGPVTYLQYQLLGSAGSEVVVGTAGNDFINLLGGDDAANGAAGNDVLDGGAGSNFLTGGAGSDVFFLDERSGQTTWSTIADWQAGEQLSLFGWRLGVSQVTWEDRAGAAGFEGATLHADLDGNGSIDASVTWTGIARSTLPSAIELDGLLWIK